MYGVDKKDLDQMLSDIENEKSIFLRKDYLDTSRFPSLIVGRKEEAEKLLRFLNGYRQGFVVPFISVYGKSGSGKSTTVRFVCENIPWILPCFVNLRNAKTVFGCANLILNELGIPSLTSAQGINVAVEKMTDSIESLLDKKKDELFVLVLDEFDILFLDRRGSPSEFVYKLLAMEQKLQEKGHNACIIAISNNMVADYDLDDRVGSRIGSSEISFSGYYKSEIVEILTKLSEKALSVTVDPEVIDYCAEVSQDQGDARRSIDILRAAAELAGQEGKITKEHIDEASRNLHDQRITTAIMRMTPQLKFVCAAIAQIAYIKDKNWNYTSDIYMSYCIIMRQDMVPSEQAQRWKRNMAALKKAGILEKVSEKPHSFPEYPVLGYRRVSDLLKDLENTGLVTSRAGSRGRYGYGREYKLAAPPEIIGPYCLLGWWGKVEGHKQSIRFSKLLRSF